MADLASNFFLTPAFGLGDFPIDLLAAERLRTVADLRVIEYRERWQGLIAQIRLFYAYEGDPDRQGFAAPHASLIDGALSLAESLRDKGGVPATCVFVGPCRLIYFIWPGVESRITIEVVGPGEGCVVSYPDEGLSSSASVVW